MLITSRRQGESIFIGDDIEIAVAHIGRSRVRFAIRAPREVPVQTKEARLVRAENLAAASGPAASSISSLLNRFQSPRSSSPLSDR